MSKNINLKYYFSIVRKNLPCLSKFVPFSRFYAINLEKIVFDTFCSIFFIILILIGRNNLKNAGTFGLFLKLAFLFTILYFTIIFLQIKLLKLQMRRLILFGNVFLVNFLSYRHKLNFMLSLIFFQWLKSFWVIFTLSVILGSFCLRFHLLSINLSRCFRFI